MTTNSQIVVNYMPFLMHHDIYVYVNGECVEQAKVELNRINSVVLGYTKKYNINRVYLCGNENYLSEFQMQMMNKFAENSCEISIVRK